MTSAYNKILGLLAILLVVPSCMKLEQETLEDQNIIGFNVVQQTLKTKAAFSTSSTFMTSAYRLGAGQAWTADYNSATPEFGPEKVSYQTGGYWTTSTKHYWPDAGSLTFFSYSFAKMSSAPTATISKDGVSISNYNVTDNPDGEILVADIAMDKTRNESYAGFTGVPTHFRHKLARLQFKFALSDLAEEGTKVTLNRITMSEIYSIASYSRGGYPNDSWGGHSGLVSDASPIVIFDDAKELTLEPELLGSCIAVPQYLAKISETQHSGIVVSYTLTNPDLSVEHKEVQCYFDEHFMSGSWEPGKIHTYTIRIGVGLYPIRFSGSVKDWGVGKGGDVEIGG